MTVHDGGTPAEALRVRDVVKTFGRRTAVDHVDLGLPAGEFFSLLGPSGCGKTTLLRLIAGLETPDRGHIHAGGAEITRLPPERRPFNMVFQRYALFPHLTVADNVAFGLTTSRSGRPSTADIRRRTSDILDLVGLSDHAGHLPRQLSGGQAQRVAIARALVRRPRVLLLDEPMAALDRNVRHQVREELLRLHRETGTTFLMVTHDQEEALSVSQRVGLMADGRLEQVATPEMLYRAPETLFAARFVGAGSLLPGRVTGPDSGGRVGVDCHGLRFAPRAADGAGDARQVQVLLRPQELTVTAADPASVTGSVLTCSFFGAYFELVVRTELGPVRVHHGEPVAPGTTIGLRWPQHAGTAYPQPAAG